MNSKTLGWVRKAFSFVAFFCVPAVLLVLIAKNHERRRDLREEIAKLEERRDELQVLADRLQADESAAYGAKRTLWSLLREARSADDIPNLGGNRIISDHRGTEVLSMYVPSGNHTLEVKAKWGPLTGWLKQAPKDGSPDEPDPDVPTGEQAWSVPLLPASGYWFELVSRRTAFQPTSQVDRVTDSVQWMLTSSHADFQPRREVLPFEGFKQRGASWSGSGVVAFANQIEPHWNDKSIASAEGVKLMTTKLLGPWKDEQFEVAFEVRIISVGPPSVSASDAIRLVVTKRGDILSRYDGGGRYSVRVEEQ